MQSPAKTSAQTSAAHLNPCLRSSCHPVATSPPPKGPRLGGLAPNGDTGGVLGAGSPATSLHGPLPSSPAFCSWSSPSSSRCKPRGGIWPVASSGEVCKRVFVQQGGLHPPSPAGRGLEVRKSKGALRLFAQPSPCLIKHRPFCPGPIP